MSDSQEQNQPALSASDQQQAGQIMEGSTPSMPPAPVGSTQDLESRIGGQTNPVLQQQEPQGTTAAATAKDSAPSIRTVQ